jgi:hypothetical protein
MVANDNTKPQRSDTMGVKLTDKAMLVLFSASQWTARKFDKKVTAEIADIHKTDSTAGRYNKVLIAQNALKAIQQIVGEARSYHYAQTLPWRDDEYRMLPAAAYPAYIERMRQFKSRFESAVAEFISAYPQLVEEAMIRLNGMFNQADYPHPSEIAHKYSMSVSIMPLPTSDDFRVSLQSDEIAQIKQAIEESHQQAEQRAMADLWTRLHEVVAHMADTLSKEDKVFRNSLVGNVSELCGLLPTLNVMGDANLEAMRQAVESKLCGYDPETLRTDKDERKQAADDAQKILDAMASYIG